MTDERKTKVDNATRLTGVARAADTPELRGEIDRVPPAEPAPYVKEPLFSRRVMIGWAIGTLVVWFGLTVVVPAVVRSIKAAVVQSVPPDGTTRVIRARNGTTITIKGGPDGGITIDRGGRGAAAPVPSTKAGPTVVEPVEPREPLPPPEPTGKK